MKTNRYFLASAFCIVILFVAPLQGIPEIKVGQEPAPSDQLIAVCIPGKLFPHVGETIDLHVYGAKQDKAIDSYAWNATGGKVIGQGSSVKWDFTGVKPGIYEATVRFRDSKGNTRVCNVEVTVISPLNLKGGKYTTSRGFLIRGENEADGYGLYSYFLLGSRADNANRERYLSAIKEYLRLSEAIELLKVLREKNEINITYLPLKIAPGEDLLKKLEVQDDKNYAEVAAWLLEHYDFERAKVLLKKLEGSHVAGPYIVSFLTPLTGNNVTPPYLYQDQSLVPPDLIASWMKLFIIQSEKEKFWEAETMRTMVLKMRLCVGVIGQAVPEVTKELDNIIALKKKLGA
jgi:hypothetical protein